MSSTDLAILIASIATTLTFCQFGIARNWVRTLKAKPWAAFFILVWFSSSLLPIPTGEDVVIGVLSYSQIARISIIAFISFVSAFVILQYPKSIKLAGGSSTWMAFYGILAMLSAVYSVSPVISLWKGFEVFSYVLSGIYLSRYLKTMDSIRWLMDLVCLVFLFLVISMIYGVIIAPSEAFPKTLSTSDMAFAAFGVMPMINANTVTQISGMLFCLALANINAKPRSGGRTIIWIIIGLSFVMLLLGHSRTSIFGTALVFFIILITGRHFMLAGLLGFIASMALLYGASDYVIAYITRGQSAEVFSSMSGRTVFWDNVWPTYLKSPIIGHGFYSQRAIYGLSSLDNTYLQVLVGLGAVGLTVFIIPIIITAYKLLKARPSRGTPYMEKSLWLQLTSVYALILIRSFTGPTFQNIHINLILMMIILVAVSAFVRSRSTKVGLDI